MAVDIKGVDEGEVEWLRTFFAKMLNPSHSSVYFLIANDKHLRKWLEYTADVPTGAPAKTVEAPVEATPPKRRGRPPGSKNKPKTTTNKRIPKADRVNHFGCDAHPGYGHQRPPRTDCDRCWELYKKFHTLEYPNARRKFELKQHLKAKEA